MKFITFLICAFLFFNTLFAQDSSFILSTNTLKDYTPGFIGNGYFSLVTTKLGLDGAESYMDGLFDHAEQDIPRIAALPYWNKIDISLNTKDSSELVQVADHISNYYQEINLFNGTLTTRYNYSFSNKKIEIENTAFISRSNKNLAVIKLTVKPSFSGVIKLSFPLVQRKRPERKAYATLTKIEPNPPHTWPQEWYPGFVEVVSTRADKSNNYLELIGQTEGKKSKIIEAAVVDWDENVKESNISRMSNDSTSSLTGSFKAEKNKSYTFYKYIYISKINSSEDTSNIYKKLKNSVGQSYKNLATENNNAWKDLWATDIVVEGNPKFQKVIHSMLFYLLASSRKDMSFSIPPMGLSSAGYYGHVFWDSDTWMFPALLLTHPDIARAMVMFRFKALDAAKENAKKNGYEGAMFPWESDDVGEESIPYFAYQNALYEIHITGDVAFAQWEYFLATQDTNYLKNYGWPVIKNCADFWKSRVTYNQQKDKYDIDSVVSVDEGLIGIKNDTYTNSLAKKTLIIATEAASLAGQKPDPAWREIASKILIPFDSVNNYHPTFEDAPQKYIGSVVTLLDYPLNMEPNIQTRINDLNNAIKLQKREGQGVMMGTTFLPIMAAELDEMTTFNYSVKASYLSNLQSPFNALTETPTNYNYNFLTGAGGFLQQVIFGYSGLRITKFGLKDEYTPHLPEGINKISFKNFKFRGKSFNATIWEGRLERN